MEVLDEEDWKEIERVNRKAQERQLGEDYAILMSWRARRKRNWKFVVFVSLLIILGTFLLGKLLERWLFYAAP